MIVPSRPEPLQMSAAAAAGQSERWRRTSDAARVTLLAVATTLLVGVLCATALLFAHFKIENLVLASQVHMQTVTRLVEKIAPILQADAGTKISPEFVKLYLREFAQIRTVEKERRADVDAILAALQTPFMRQVGFIDSSDIAEFRRSDIEPALLSLADQLSLEPGQRLTGLAEPQAGDQYRGLTTALGNGELLYPLSRRVTLATEMMQRGVAPLLWILAGVALLVLAGIWLVWQTALMPALEAARTSAQELAAQNDTLRRAEEKFAAAKRIAKLSYWYKEPGDRFIKTENMSEALGLPLSMLPQSFEQLAALSPDGQGADMSRAYHALEASDGAIELSRAIAVPGRESTTIRERVESRLREGGRQITGIMLEISELTQANNQLARLERVKMIETLIAGIAHDFNNMLGIIQGNAEAARNGPSAQHIESILVASRSAAALIQKLQVNVVEQDTRIEAFSPRASIQAVIDAMQHAGMGSDTIAFVDTLGCPDTICVNRGLFENAILNILKNAREAAGSEVRIEIAMSRLDAKAIATAYPVEGLAGRDEDFICIEIADNGPGMSEEVRLKALEPFFSTKSARRGLGLWSVYSFLKSCRGAVQIVSPPSRGTSIRLYFPADVALEPTAPPTSAPPRIADGAGKILLIEDNADFASILEEHLLRIGYQAIHVHDADAGERIIRSGAPLAVVLADINLGSGSSGPDLMRRIAPDYPGLHFIFMSGGTTYEELLLANGPGAWSFLRKPFALEKLDQAISLAQ